MDVTVVVLPMPVLWGLQMAVSKKIVLSMMFGLGVMYVSRPPPAPMCRQENPSLTTSSICIITLIRIQITTVRTFRSHSSLHQPETRFAIHGAEHEGCLLPGLVL